MRTLTIDFGKKLRVWDGFGINYVETCQTRDYDKDPQDYGGFSVLEERQRLEILEAIFGDDGLQPALIKMFLDPFHRSSPDAVYDHRKSTGWMLEFVRYGVKQSRARGQELQIITSLYGPPGWMTVQKFTRGRDLASDQWQNLADYFIAWLRFLREEEGMPVKYVSIHNEGEDWMRWPLDGSTDDASSHDYNLYWSPSQVVKFIPFLRRALDAAGLEDIGITPGETTTWVRFDHWGYAAAIANDERCLRDLGLITSHAFWDSYPGLWNGDHRSTGTDTIRDHRPELHAWSTSSGWGRKKLSMMVEICQNIYSAKVNGFIPWAAVQRHDVWVGGDPNPATAFVVSQNQYRQQKEYYIYKHVCRCGKGGSAVVPLFVNDTEIYGAAFSEVDRGQANAFVVANLSDEEKVLDLNLSGVRGKTWEVACTHDAADYEALGRFIIADTMTLKPWSVTSFVESMEVGA
ncbi:MAG: hypothetical protein LR015_14405 [Verrucomicrobia bacterium]|nr:hypothetical protein [Verrucomicrobiota bacterium]